MDAHYCKMHAHKILWALTCYEWAHTSYLCAAIHYAWSPKYVAIFTHLWATMILCVVSHAIAVVAHNTACTTTTACGFAAIVAHGHPGKIWSLTRFAGQPRIANGHPHSAMWLRMSCTCTPMLVHTVWAWARICMRTQICGHALCTPTHVETAKPRPQRGRGDLVAGVVCGFIAKL